MMDRRGAGGGGSGPGPTSGGGTAAGFNLRQGICGSSSRSSGSTRDGLADGRSDSDRVSASRSLFGAYGSGGLAGESDEALIDALLTLT